MAGLPDAGSAGTAYVKFRGDFTQLTSEMAGAMAPGKLSKIGKVGGGAIAAGLVAAGIGKALFDIGKEFDDAYDKIRVETGKTGRAFETLKRDFREVVKGVPASFADAGQAVGQLNARLNQTGRPLVRMSKQMLELSRITDTDLGENIESASRVIRDFAIPVRKQEGAMNRLFRASQASGVGFSDLARKMVQFGSPLRQLGFNFDRTAALFAEFEAQGVNIQTAMPGLRLALSSFAEAGKDPVASLSELIAKIKETGSTQEAYQLQIGDLGGVLDIFGKRAGADLVSAVKEGRLELGKTLGEIRGGKDTILRAGKDTRDFGEHWKVFSNNLKVFVEPAASFVFETIGEGMKQVSLAFRGKGGLAGIAQSIRKFWNDSLIFREAMGLVWDRTKKAVSGIVDMLRGLLQIGRGIVKIFSGVLTGNFGRAWDGVKDIFKGAIKNILGFLKLMTAPLRAIIRTVGRVMGRAFSGAWNTVKGIFEDGKDAVIGFINDLIRAINAIPIVPDIGLIDVGDGGGGGAANIAKGRKPGGGATQGARARGGFVDRPQVIVGEEGRLHPEFVIATNPAYRRRNLKLWAAAGRDLGIPGFQFGGITNALGDVKDFGADALSKLDPRNVFDDFPSVSDLPEWLRGMGDWLLDHAKDFVKDKLGGLFGGGGGSIVLIGHLLEKLGYDVGEHPAFGGVQSGGHVGGSLHYQGRAIDVNWPGGDEMSKLDAIYPFLARLNPAELLWRVADHWDHLHLGLKRGGIIPGLKTGGSIGKFGKPAHGRHWIHGGAAKSPSGTRWGMSEAATLLWQAGATPAEAKLLARKVPGESTGDPRAVGHDPGGTTGLGLWQIATGFHDDLIRKFSPIFNPINNAKAALSILRSEGIGAWYAGTSGGNVEILKKMIGSERGGGNGKPKGKIKGPKPIRSLGKDFWLTKRIASLTQTANLADEYATRAESIEGAVFGKDQIGWLNAALAALFRLRNALVRMRAILTAALASVTKRLGKSGLPKGMRKGLMGQRSDLRSALSDNLSTLTDIQGIGSPMGVMSKLPALGVLGGRILSTQLALRGDAAAVADTTGLTGAQLTELGYLAKLGVTFNPSQFAGFFASGGRLGARQWGIAGEAGPELVSGPAQISPMGGGPEIRVYIGDQEIRATIREEIRSHDAAGNLNYRTRTL